LVRLYFFPPLGPQFPEIYSIHRFRLKAGFCDLQKSANVSNWTESNLLTDSIEPDAFSL
jgi:hypothetical protein